MVKNLLFTFFLVSISLFSQDEKRLALVIGNANYEKGELKNPVNDAKLIAQTLDSLDFDVILATNLEDQRSFLNTIREFGNKRPDYDVGFVYYAGHGVQIAGENYLLPTKEIYESKNDIEDYAVNVAKIMKYLTEVTNQVNILILDACRDNPFEQNWNATRSLKGEGLAKMPPPTGSLIAFSTDAGNTAADGDGENSIYCKSLVKNMLLENTTLDQVFRNVRTDVLKASNNMQRPIESSQLTGQAFYLVKSDYSEEIKNIEELVEKEKFIDALEIASLLVENDPSSRSYLIRANIYTKTKNYQNAINDYINSLKINPDNSEALFLVGKLFYYSRQFEEAIDYLSQCINLDCNPEAYMYRGRSYSNLNQDFSNQILEDWTKFLELHPNSPYANYGVGMLKTKTEEKLKYLEKAIELEIQYKSNTKIGLNKDQFLLSSASYEAAILHYKSDNINKAFEFIDLAIETYPYDENAYVNKLKLILDFDDRVGREPSSFELKKLDIENLINKLSEFSIYHNESLKLLVTYFRYIGKIDNALEIIETGIKLNPDNVGLKNTKGTVLIYSGRFKDAAETFRLIVEKDSTMSGSKNNLAVSYYYLAEQEFYKGENELAINYYKKAEEVWLNYLKTESERGFLVSPYQWLSNLFRNLAEIYLEKSDDKLYKYYLNKYKEITLEGIRKSDGTYSPLYQNLAFYYQHLLDICDNCDEEDLKEKILLAKEKVIEINPESSRGYLSLFFEYDKYKNFEKAEEMINEALKVLNYYQSPFYYYKIGYLLNFRRYEECLSVIEELENFYEINGYHAPRSYEENQIKYFEEFSLAKLSHLKSYIYFNAGKEFESLLEINNSINIISEIYNNDSSVYKFYHQPHDSLGEHPNENLDNETVFRVSSFSPKIYGDGINRNNFYNLYVIRANIFSKIGLDNKACEDYNSALQLTNEDSESRSKIEKLISENCGS